MKTLEEQIAVMQAFQEGKEIEHRHPHFDWEDDKELIWDWSQYDYRVKEENEWLTPDELKQLPVDTLLYVNDTKGRYRETRYFSHYDEFSETIYCFSDGTTSQSHNGGHTSWKYAKLYKNAKSIIQWYKNTGKRPDCEEVLVKFNCGEKIVGSLLKEHVWRIGDDDFDIREYAIIK
jgi:hypothetical protein